MFGARVPGGPQQNGVPESSGSELCEEGPAFLGPRNSRKPVVLGNPGLPRERLRQDQLCDIGTTAGVDDPGDFSKDRLPIRVQVEDSVDQHAVNAAISEREAFP